MILGFLTLFTALCISGIAAYYSIVGLTAIFAAAVLPIIVMGAVLESGKVMTTLWLHYNWERAEWKIKVYLVSAVGILMLITSMGIFGFLSKAHLDQAVPTGDIAAQVSLFDEKIKTQRDNIDSSRKALTQMDSAVDQMMSRTTDDTGAQKSANLRRAQQKERANLQKDIELAQKEITKLQEQRAPLATQFRKVEAEVGPIKYIAALIYGDKADQNMLEAAVRWVIIIIVMVFDPLAIVLILAATTSIDWAKKDRAKRKAQELTAIPVVNAPSAPMEVEAQMVTADSDDTLVDAINEAIELTRAECEAEFEKTKLSEWNKFAEIAAISASEEAARLAVTAEEKTHLMNEVSEITGMLTTMVESTQDLTTVINELEEEVTTSLTKQHALQSDLATVINEYDDLLEEKSILRMALDDALGEIEVVKEIAARTVELESVMDAKEAEIASLREQLVNATAPAPIIEDIPSNEEMLQIAADTKDDFYKSVFAAVEEIAKESEVTPLVVINPVFEEQPESGTLTDPEVAKAAFDAVMTDRPEYFKPAQPLLPSKHKVDTPPVTLQADNFPMGGNASFGTQFPVNPLKGDLFLRVDFMPSKLFKWVGSRWIEIDKAQTDTYIYNDEYIKMLVDKVSNNEYDIDDLNSTEQEQVAQYLLTHPQK